MMKKEIREWGTGKKTGADSHAHVRYVLLTYKKHPFTPICLSCVIEKLADNTVNTKLELMNQYSRQVRVQGDTLRETCSDVFGFHRNSERVCGLALFHDGKRVQTCTGTVKTISPGRLLANQDGAQADVENNVLLAFVPQVYVCLCTFKPHVYP